MSSSPERLARMPPEAVIVVSFVLLITLGTGLLLLPFCWSDTTITPIDALFTATSAVCVTGLTVLDTGADFSLAGQVVILALIQIGGLGIITLSSFFAVIMGKRMPVRQQEIVRQTYSSFDARSFLRLVRRIVLFTLGFELLGAAGLFVSWRDDFPTVQALGYSLFHAVSAFCNAGFSTFSGNLVAYRGDWAVNLIIMALIFLGGIGFLVIYDVERRLFYRSTPGVRELSLHSKLALFTSVVLIVAGTLIFLVLEYGNALGPMSFGDKILASLFQAVSPRTAGFNSVDLGMISSTTMVLIMLLMFVGGSPGSTAGGIKTTTLAVILVVAYNRFRGNSTANVLRRTIPEKNITEAGVIVIVSLAVLLLFNFGLGWSESGSVPHRQDGALFIDSAFETVSAFATVGLSTGITPDLSDWGKIQIALLMLIGRVGPLTIAVAVARRRKRPLNLEYYRENVMVG